MAEVDLGGGVVVETAERVQVRRITPAAGRPFGLAADQDELGAALQGAGFTLAAQMDLRRKPGVALTATTSAPAQVKVEVAKGQSAVVLLEGEGGVFGWGFPDAQAGMALAADSGRTLTFTLASRRPSQSVGFGIDSLRRGPIFNWLIDKMVEPVRAYVLKFAAGAVIKVAVDKIEGDMALGMVNMAGGLASWTPGGAPLPALPAGRPAKILLMVHGTFSTTAGSYGDLTRTANGTAFLTKARGAYDAVVGFDHKTLARTPEENARDMLDGLIAWGLPPGSQIDAVSYSRGGLVYRAFAEQLLATERPDIKLGKAVFVACTNGGTNLAEPKNWEALTEVYTNLLLAGARVAAAVGGVALSPMAVIGIKTLGRFVQAFSEVAITERKVPGLAAMRPASPLVKALNSAQGGLDRLASYRAVTSDFKPKFEPSKGISKELAQALLDRVTNRLFQEKNDLVVHTRAMTEFGTRASRLAAGSTLDKGSGESVHHTIYFGDGQIDAALTTWLP